MIYQVLAALGLVILFINVIITVIFAFLAGIFVNTIVYQDIVSMSACTVFVICKHLIPGYVIAIAPYNRCCICIVPMAMGYINIFSRLGLRSSMLGTCGTHRCRGRRASRVVVYGAHREGYRHSGVHLHHCGALEYFIFDLAIGPIVSFTRGSCWLLYIRLLYGSGGNADISLACQEELYIAVAEAFSILLCSPCFGFRQGPI